MVRLPDSALSALEKINESFPEVPISGTTMRRFDLPHVRAALAKAGREGKKGQTAAALLDPPAKGGGVALVVLRADDLGKLLSAVEGRAQMGQAEPGGEQTEGEADHDE
jgi:hypothetical protein